jgi:hypothetical protein
MRPAYDLRRRLQALGTSCVESRGNRFARRMGLTRQGQTLPNFSDIMNLPDWMLCEGNIVSDIAAVTALLHFRHAIDQELSGKRLRAICDSVGESNFDIACAAPLPALELMADVATELPSPDQLRPIGQTMLNDALPARIRPCCKDSCADANMRILSDIATALVIGQVQAPMENPT